jgi:hypothetical protein
MRAAARSHGLSAGVPILPNIPPPSPKKLPPDSGSTATGIPFAAHRAGPIPGWPGEHGRAPTCGLPHEGTPVLCCPKAAHSDWAQPDIDVYCMCPGHDLERHAALNDRDSDKLTGLSLSNLNVSVEDLPVPRSHDHSCLT